MPQEFNPDEQVWNEIKHQKLGREPMIDKADLKNRLLSNLIQLKFDVPTPALIFPASQLPSFPARNMY